MIVLAIAWWITLFLFPVGTIIALIWFAMSSEEFKLTVFGTFMIALMIVVALAVILGIVVAINA